MKIKFFALSLLLLTLLACTSSTPTQDINPPIPLNPTDANSTAIPNIAIIPTQASTFEPVTAPNSNGWVIYDDTNNIVSINLDTGETKVLISRKEIQSIIVEDKSALSYTYGYEKPIKINLSPDFTKAHISICASLDNNFRCIYEDYIYTLKSKSAIRLQPVPDAYGVYWQWSPDSSKLAGAAWTYVETTYQLLKFYSINNTGRDLRELSLITNDDWQFAWHPGNTAILPLTSIQNFRSILTDGTHEPSISMPGLAPNDRVVCIGFSPDYSKVAFVLRQEISRNQDSLYVARSDFQEISLINSFPNDPRYSCQLHWSADQNFIHLDYQYIHRQESGLPDLSNQILDTDKVINILTKQEITPPSNAQTCGFKPEHFIYMNNDSGTGFFNLINSEFTNLPDNVRSTMQHCPIQWFAQEPEPEVSQGIAIENACHPNATYADDDQNIENIPAVFDLVEASSTLDGEVLSVVLKSSKFTEYLVEYITPDVTDFLNGWDVFIDIDNNTLTGDSVGVEYRFSVAIRAGSEPQIGSVILAYDPTTDSYTRAGVVDVRFDTLNQTINLTGTIPSITPNSRLVFLSRLKDFTTREITGDRICE